MIRQSKTLKNTLVCQYNDLESVKTMIQNNKDEISTIIFASSISFFVGNPKLVPIAISLSISSIKISLACPKILESVKTMIQNNKDEIACIILEPVACNMGLVEATREMLKHQNPLELINNHYDHDNYLQT